GGAQPRRRGPPPQGVEARDGHRAQPRLRRRGRRQQREPPPRGGPPRRDGLPPRRSRLHERDPPERAAGPAPGAGGRRSDRARHHGARRLPLRVTETGLIIAEVAFLVLLYLFIWTVVRSSPRSIREPAPPPAPRAEPRPREDTSPHPVVRAEAPAGSPRVTASPPPVAVPAGGRAGAVGGGAAQRGGAPAPEMGFCYDRPHRRARQPHA